MELPKEFSVRYLERRKKDLEECVMSLQLKNFPLLQQVGHRLKGNGVTFGHPELSLIGKSLEQAATLRDQLKIERALNEFSNWVTSRTSLNSSL